MITAAVAEGGNGDVTIHRLPGLNHLFQPGGTGLVGEYGAIEESIAPQVLELIQDWLLTRAPPTPSVARPSLGRRVSDSVRTRTEARRIP